MKNLFTSFTLIVLFSTSLFSQRQMEGLDRGLVAVKVSTGVFLSWRILGTDDKNTQFNIYKNGTTLVNSTPLTYLSNYTDASGTLSDKYTVKALLNGNLVDMSATVTPWSQQYLNVKLNRPASGLTPSNVTQDGTSSGVAVYYPDGEPYSYTPNDMSVADLDGDGQYELIVKWDPTNSKDNSQTGITGEVFLDAYKLDGTQLWRISLGKNIRAGAHYTQFLVYDFDGDGKAEVICKTAPGTIDGKGNYVIMGNDDPTADYRNLNIAYSGNKRTGVIQNGSEYLTLFDGMTGAELNTIPYKPDRSGSWGDSYGNRADRFLACVAYLDGKHPSAVMCRGYYTRATLAAYDVADKKLVQRWFYDSGTTASSSNIYGQGNHNLSVGDVDGDGKDEIIYGSSAINDDGTMLYNTGLGHGDAVHLSDLNPDRDGLEVFAVKENSSAFSQGYEMHDAKTGEILWYGAITTDNGRGLAADVDGTNRGFEAWSSQGTGTYSCKGVQVSTKKPSINFRIYWDGDLQDELLDGTTISKWLPASNKTTNLLSPSGLSSCNGTKATPNLSADLFGDWREEVIWWDASDSSSIRIYTTTTPTTYGLYTLMHDPIYRLGIAWQNVAYNQPPHLGFYIGDGLSHVPTPNIYTVGYAYSGINETSAKEVACDVRLIDGTLYLNSDMPMKSMVVYNESGQQVCQKLVGSTNYSVKLSCFTNKIFMVKVVTLAGVRVFKLMNDK